MEAKELMIGNIVSYNGAICRVISTECYGNLVGIESNTICELVSDAELSPIPLTEKILNKNGWNAVRHCVYGRDFIEDIKGKTHTFPIPFRVCISDAYCHEKIFATISEDVLCVFLYVHELQRALRCCGLNDIADNIKV